MTARSPRRPRPTIRSVAASFPNAVEARPATPEERLAEAFANLRIAPGQERWIPVFVHMLAGISGEGSGSPPGRYRAANSKVCHQQLEQVAKAAERLADRIEDLFAPSIAALAETGVLPDVLAAQAHEWAALCRGWADRAHSAQLKIEGPSGLNGGRPPDCRAEGVAQIVATAYCRLTGKTDIPFSKSKPTFNRRGLVTPGKPTGPFVRLVAAIFETLGIDASAEHYAEAVKRQRNAQK